MTTRLQHRLNNLKIRVKNNDKTKEHFGWLYLDREKERLKFIINYELEDETKIEPEYFVYNDLKVKKIAEVLLMYINDSDISEIKSTLGLSKSSIYSYIDQYRKNKQFLKQMYKRPKQTISKLEVYQYKIADDFETACIRTYKEAQERIFKITKINISIPRIRKFLITHEFEKIDGYYKQILTKEGKTERLIYEKQFLNENVDEIREYIFDNYLQFDYRLVSKIRKEFGIKYVPNSRLNHYLYKNKMKGNNPTKLNIPVL